MMMPSVRSYEMFCTFKHPLNCAFRFRYGLRTINEMRNLSGIVGYGVATVRDRDGGIGLTGPPSNYHFVRSTQEQFTISVPKYQFKDGDVVVVWFTVSDTAGNKDDVRLTVGLDRSRPNVTADKFKLNTLDEFTSS